MPQLELTELEAKVAWMIVDRSYPSSWRDETMGAAEISLFAKLYRAYRGMPPEKAA